MKTPTHVKKFLLILFCLLSAAAWSQPYVVLPDGNRVDVDRILVRPNGDIVVTIDGQPRDITQAQYQRAVGVRPNELDRAESLVAEGNRAEAVPILTGIIASSRYQSWDAMAGVMLMNVHLAKGEPNEANEVLSTLRRRYGDELESFFPAVELAEWRTRVAIGEVEGLEEELSELLRSEDTPRERRVNAQLVRGDLKMRRKAEESAILDYLRAVYFFSDFPEIHAEALFKTATAFAEIGDSARLRRYQQRLKEQHPDSEFATRDI